MAAHKALILAVSFLAACTLSPFLQNSPVPIAETIEYSPEEPTVVEPRTYTKPAPKKKKAPVPAVATSEDYEMVNPLAECGGISIEDPTEAVRAKLNCIQMKLNIQPEP